MFVIRFKEIEFESTSVKELFFTADREKADHCAENLNLLLKKSLREMKSDSGIFRIPELGILLSSLTNIMFFEVVEVQPLENLEGLSFEKVSSRFSFSD